MNVILKEKNALSIFKSIHNEFYIILYIARNRHITNETFGVIAVEEEESEEDGDGEGVEDGEGDGVEDGDGEGVEDGVGEGTGEGDGGGEGEEGGTSQVLVFITLPEDKV